MATVLESLQKDIQKERKSRREAAVKERLMLSLMEEHVLPHMPKTLEAHFELGVVLPTYGRLFSGVSLSFRPRVDMSREEENRRAIGTITKVASGLKRGGWKITTEPHAIVREYSKDMGIQLSAVRDGDKGSQITISLTFGGIKNTGNCRLVEKEVIVKAVYAPEHTETRLVVECDD